MSARARRRASSRAEKWIAFLHGLRAALPGLTPALFWSPGAEDDPRHPGDDAKARRILDACASLGVIPCPTATLDDLMAGLACLLRLRRRRRRRHARRRCLRPADRRACSRTRPFKLAHWYPWQVRHELVASPTFAIGDIEPQVMVAATQRLLNAPRPS